MKGAVERESGYYWGDTPVPVRVNDKQLPGVVRVESLGDMVELLVDATKHGDPGLSITTGDSHVLTLPTGRITEAELSEIVVEYDYITLRFSVIP